MKTILSYAVLLILLVSTTLSAQTSTERKTMSEGVYEAIVIQIPDLEPKIVSDLWTEFTKDFYDVRTKYNRKTKEYFSDDAEIAAIGKGNTVDIYTNVESKGNGSEVSVWFDLGGAYLSAREHSDRHLEAEKMMLRFGLEAAKEKVRLDIKAQEKDLDNLMGDLKKLENDKERLQREIEKAQEAIARAEKGLEENADEQENKNAEIKAQEELIEATKRKLKDL